MNTKRASQYSMTMDRLCLTEHLVQADNLKTVYYQGELVHILPRVYEPAEDTYLLLKTAWEEVKPTDAVLEVGTGCGLIAKMLAKRARHVMATDINPFAVMNARFNGVDTIEANLFGGLDQKFDLIIFNPPYLPADENTPTDWYAKAWNGGPSGAEVILDFISEVCAHLTKRGKAQIVVSSLTGYRSIIERMRLEFAAVKAVAECKCFFEKLYVLAGQEPRTAVERFPATSRSY